MRQPQLIYEGNTTIVYLDFSGLKTKEEILESIDVFQKYIKKQPLNSVVTLTNLENMHFNTEIFNAFTAYVKTNNPYVKESAVVGLKGMMQIFYKGFIKVTGRNVTVCSSREEALTILAGRVATAI